MSSYFIFFAGLAIGLITFLNSANPRIGIIIINFIFIAVIALFFVIHNSELMNKLTK